LGGRCSAWQVRDPAPEGFGAGRPGQEVDRYRGHVDGQLTLGRDRVYVQRHTGTGQHLGDRGDQLEGADLVALPANGDEDRIVGDAGAELLRIYPAELVGRNLGDPEALLLQVLAYVMERDVLDLGDDRVVAGPLVPAGVADERQVVRLGGAITGGV